MDYLTAGVAKGLLGASNYLKYADVAMGVYQQAKAEGDQEKMKRALGYATDSMTSAVHSTEDAQEALEKAKIQAREEEKAEQKAALEEQPNKPSQQAESNKHTATKPAAVDTVKISKEAQAAIEGTVSDELSPDAVSTTNTASNQPAQGSVTIQIYTPQGKVGLVLSK